MPKNKVGKRIAPAEWNRSDGFSPASSIVVQIPDLDVVASALPPVTDIGASLKPGSALVLVDVTSGKRIAAWAELDANAAVKAHQALLVVPAAAMSDGHQYAVGLQHLKTTHGTEIVPSSSFSAAVRDKANATWLNALRTAGAAVPELDLAWTFTIASTRSLTGRLESMWKETRSEIGEGAPEFNVDSTSDAGSMRVIDGSFAVPQYLQGDGSSGSLMNNDGDPNGIPTRNGTMRAQYTCTVPKAATAAKPAYMMAYGHGLLGSRAEVRGIGTLAALANVGLCALDFIGMSAGDVGTLASEFEDLTKFRATADRLQQGHLAFLLLGRLLRSANGFATNPAFQTADGGPVIDTSRAGFLGASQGGILGGAPSALTADWDKVVLAVGGIGYNLLLRRSVDFDKFVPAIEAQYSDELDQVMILELMEQLWARGENAGYSQHLTRDLLPGAIPKQVLLLEAFGDHQVANVSTEKLARSIGVSLKVPSLAPGRSKDTKPQWGIPPITHYPFRGSSLIVWDFGSPAPPTTNTPPRSGEDPHGDLGESPDALTVLLPFVNDGILDNPCGGTVCGTK